MALQESPFPKFMEEIKNETSSAFEDNMRLAIHRWYRYTAVFSAVWVAKVIEEEIQNGRGAIIDPFGGSGTVLIESSKRDGVSAYGLEANPYVFKIANAKLQWNKLSLEHIKSLAQVLIAKAQEIDNDVSQYPSLILKCYPEAT